MNIPTPAPAPADCPDCLALARALTEARRAGDQPAETEIHTRLRHHWSEIHSGKAGRSTPGGRTTPGAGPRPGRPGGPREPHP